MKKLLFTFLFTTIFAFTSFSMNDNNEDNDSTEDNINLEFENKGIDPQNGRNRTPIYMSLDVIYNHNNQILEVCYYGENNGEILLYHNNTLVNYSSELNTTFQLTNPGLYKIEIIEETWIATGYVKL